MDIVTRLDEQSFAPAAELDQLLEAATDAGAVVSFVGVTRPRSKAGDKLVRLVLEHHPHLTAQSLKDIAADAGRRFEVSAIRVVHRCGEIAPGDPIVFAGAASPHRRAAFECADYLMDRLKTEAILWKREEAANGSTWIEPTDQDHSDRERWG